MNLLNLSIKRKLILMTMLTSSIALLLSDRKSTRLNSSHDQISYAVFCLKKKRETDDRQLDRPFAQRRQYHRYIPFGFYETIAEVVFIASMLSNGAQRRSPEVVHRTPTF